MEQPRVERRLAAASRRSLEVCPDAPRPGRAPTDRAAVSELDSPFKRRLMNLLKYFKEVIYSQLSSLSERCNCNLEIQDERSTYSLGCAPSSVQTPFASGQRLGKPHFH
jgi:hypothetical protein